MPITIEFALLLLAVAAALIIYAVVRECSELASRRRVIEGVIASLKFKN
mgnify:CR=1 FL=1